MIPIDTFGVQAGGHGSMLAEADHGLQRLSARLAELGQTRDAVLTLTFFVDATDATAYRRVRDALLALVARWSGPQGAIPASVVAQPPEDGTVALEATILTAPVGSVSLARRRVGEIPYVVLQSGGTRQLHAAGLASGDTLTDAEEQSAHALARMLAVLQHEDLTFGHVVRQWNYIERMLDCAPRGALPRQRYQVFNDVRTEAYSIHDFPHGYPASTGIGQKAGGVVIDFIALEAGPAARVEAISNPKQIDAHRYTPAVLVGRPADDRPDRNAPKFERAKRVVLGESEVVFVSGTAAIVGEQSVAQGDVRAQARTTLEHIAALLDDDAPTYLRGYVKHAADIPAVRAACQDAFGEVAATYVEADVCRDELLVELEAVRTAGPRA